MCLDSSTAAGWERAYAENADSQLWSKEPVPVLDEVIARAKGCCLDLGCGDGRNLLALQHGGFDVAGIDVSATALKRADSLLRAHGRSAPLVLGDIRSLPFADGLFDVVTAFDVLGQVSDTGAVLAEVRRVLRVGGLFAATFFDPSDETYGEGAQIADNTFLYKETLFRYFSLREVKEIFGDWSVEITQVAWTDPPHGSFRPCEHVHVNHLVFGRSE